MSMQNLAYAVINYRGNISIRVAAREIGISPTTLSRLEKGCEPDAKTLEKICAWMNVEASLFNGIDNLNNDNAIDCSVMSVLYKDLETLILLASERFSNNVNARGHS